MQTIFPGSDLGNNVTDLKQHTETIKLQITVLIKYKLALESGV